MKLEEWRFVVGYDEYYEISNYGNLRSLRNNRGPRSTPRPVKPKKTHDGYLRVELSKDGVRRKRPIHQLVAEAFLEERPQRCQCCHNDGDKTNNHVSNLRWDSRESNYKDRDIHGSTARGERHGCAIITEETARKIKIAIQDRSRLARDIAKEFGATTSIVRNIRNKTSWSWLKV